MEMCLFPAPAPLDMLELRGLGDLGRPRNGWFIMRVHHDEAGSKSAFLDRRGWLWVMLGGVIGSGSTARRVAAKLQRRVTRSDEGQKFARGGL